MTNDTNTLNGALRELGETMAANLTTQGVASTWDEGLTTLAGKILDITPGPTPSFDGISLTGNKSILSYADSDSCTLTAQLLDGSSSASVSGVTVEFFKGSTSLGTATTNSSGVATKSYSSTGAGDVSLTASAGTFVSETYSIEDCYLYDDATSDKSSNYTLTSNASISHNTDYYRLSTTSANQFLILTAAEDLTNASLEVTLKAATSSASGGFSIKDTNTTSFANAGTIYHSSSIGWVIHTNGTYGTQDKNLSGVTRTNYYTFKVDVYSDKMIGYVFNSGGTQLWISTLNKTLSKRYYCIGSYNSGNTSVDIKKIKVKAL